MFVAVAWAKIRTWLAMLCHPTRDPAYPVARWRSLMTGCAWVLVTVALGSPVVGTALSYLPWPPSTHDVVGHILGLLIFPAGSTLLLVLAPLLMWPARVGREKVYAAYGTDWEPLP